MGPKAVITCLPIPSTLGNSLGWDNIPDGNSIMWQNSSGLALTPGQTAAFTFQSTSTLAAITASPSGESVAYVGGIDFSQGTPGDSTGIFSPTVATPEPSTVGLLATAIPFLAASFRPVRTREELEPGLGANFHRTNVP